jgi:hypothetical protein
MRERAEKLFGASVFVPPATVSDRQAAGRFETAELVEDARVCEIEYDEHERRNKSWKKAVAESRDYRYPDFPHTGTPQTLTFCQTMADISGHPHQYF